MGTRVRKLGRPRPGARLLDIGCGRGDFILAARRRGWDVVGVEQSQNPVMDMRAQLALTVLTPEALAETPDASFDAVTLWHVLEHLPEPRTQLAQIHRLLRPGGQLVIEVPNYGGWHGRFGRAAWHHLDVPRHLLHFDRTSLGRLLSVSGFEEVRWETLSIEYDIFGFVQTVLNRICTQQNHLHQRLIGQRSAGNRADTVKSFTLLAPLAAVAGVTSLVAGAAGEGGVLRVVARKTSTA